MIYVFWGSPSFICTGWYRTGDCLLIAGHGGQYEGDSSCSAQI